MGRQAGLPTGVGIFEVNVEIGRRKHVARLFRPFDQNDRIFLQNISKSGIHPFIRIAKSIKIKVIEV